MYNLKLYGFFIGFSIMIMALCDTLAFKVIEIGGYSFASSGIIYSFSFFLASIMTEAYGYKLAGRVVWIQLACHIIFVLVVNIFSLLPSPTQSETCHHYLKLYHQFWLVLIASPGIPIAYFINDLVISKLKIYQHGKIFIFRYLISNFIGSVLLVSITYPINFHGLFSNYAICMIAWHTLVYKITIAFILLPLSIWLTKIVKKLEKLDYYDYGISYNPIDVFNTNSSGKNCYAVKQKLF